MGKAKHQVTADGRCKRERKKDATREEVIESWRCHQCNFENDASLPFCEMCGDEHSDARQQHNIQRFATRLLNGPATSVLSRTLGFCPTVKFARPLDLAATPQRLPLQRLSGSARFAPSAIRTIGLLARCATPHARRQHRLRPQRVAVRRSLLLQSPQKKSRPPAQMRSAGC
eukprot:s60_g35.t1